MGNNDCCTIRQMTVSGHIRLLALALVVWLLFLLAGLPGYYQQYSTRFMAIICILSSVVISLVCLSVLLRGKPETRVSLGVWISFYFTVPIVFLDWLYCGLYLGHGFSYLGRYWYLTIFYFTPWITLIPTALLLNCAKSDRIGELQS